MRYFNSLFVAAISVINLGSLAYTTKVELPLQYCRSNETCDAIVQNSYCNLEKMLQCDIGVCDCLHTHFPYINDPTNPEVICRPKTLSIPASCEDDIQCTSTFGKSSFCLHSPFNYTCQCKDDMVYCRLDSTCQPRLQLGDPCVCHDQCSHIKNAYCRMSGRLSGPTRCRCNDDYMQSPDGTFCMAKAEVLGQSCSVHPDQCSGLQKSICDPESKTCICDPATSVASYTRVICFPLREQLNMACWETSQCLPANSTCEYESIGGGYRRYYCGCGRSNFVTSLKDNKCLPEVNDIGNPCLDNLQCTQGYIGKNSECSSNNTCQCKQGYAYGGVWYQDWGLCLPNVQLGGYCRWDEQCLDANGSNNFTWCNEGICKCHSGELEGICYERKEIGDVCNLSAECKASISGPVLCNQTNSTCTCDENYVPSPNKMSCEMVQ